MHTSRKYPGTCTRFVSLLIIPLLAGCALSGAHTAETPHQERKWSVYRNNEFGYEIKYPAGWEMVEAAPKSGPRADAAHNVLLENEMQKVTFLEEPHGLWQGEFQIRVLANPHQYDIEGWVQHHPIEDVFGGDLIQEKTSTVLDGRPTLRLSVFGFDHEGIVLITTDNEKHIFDIAYTGANPNDPEVDEHRVIYHKMVASFGFTAHSNRSNK
jgi:hypothetical protein